MARKGRFWLFIVLTLSVACARQPSRPPQAQSAGEDVAAALNARYDDVRSACDGGQRAAYFCSGVLIRNAALGASYHFWNPRPDDEYYGVSFSYFRRDVGSRELFGQTAGFIAVPADRWSEDGGYVWQMKCSFPYDAVTSLERGPYGCGASADYPVDSRPCAEQGIVTTQAFAEHYLSVAPEPENPPDAFRRRALHQCSFGVDTFSFELSILARQGGRLEIPSRRYMELMIAEWPQDIPARLPIEAIFYTAERGAAGVEEARKGQRDFASATGRVVPIVKLDGNDAVPPFIYSENDQAPELRPR